MKCPGATASEVAHSIYNPDLSQITARTPTLPFLSSKDFHGIHEVGLNPGNETPTPNKPARAHTIQSAIKTHQFFLLGI